VILRRQVEITLNTASQWRLNYTQSVLINELFLFTQIGHHTPIIIAQPRTRKQNLQQ